MVEFALILPLVLVLTFGLIDFGLAFADAAGIKSATRSGARIGSALSKQAGQLKSIAAAVNAGLGNSTRAQATELTVYAAPPQNFTVPTSGCGGTTDGQGGLCFDQTIPADAPDVFNPLPADLTNWDKNVSWEDACPAVGNTVTAWKLAVVVKAQYPFLASGLFGANINLKETVVIDLEPTSLGVCSPSAP